MKDLLVVVPSRGRPSNAERLIEAFEQTAKFADVMLGVDDSDPTLESYPKATTTLFKGHPTMIHKVNVMAASQADDYEYLGFMGDDHLPRTVDWDQRIVEALQARGPGIAYCNDLHQGERLPTAVFMHSEIVQILGWMALPTLEHLFCDDAWLALGRALKSCTYLPDVVIEHLHPHAGKAESDAQYERVNGQERYNHDRAAFEKWRDHQLALDVEKIKSP